MKQRFAWRAWLALSAIVAVLAACAKGEGEDDLARDAAADPSADTVGDARLDGTDETGADGAEDTAGEGEIDIPVEPVIDPVVDPVPDPDVMPDPDVDPDPDPDPDPDTHPDELITGPGTVCGDPIDMTSTTSLTGSFAAYANYWAAGSGCGFAAGPEVWIRVRVPDGNIVQVGEVTTTDVTLQVVSSCVSSTCSANASSPESYAWFNSTGAAVDVLVAVEAVSSGSMEPFSLIVSNAPAPAGYDCRHPIDASAGGTWSKSYADYADLWDGASGCAVANGREIWFRATVPAAGFFRIEETTAADVTIQALTAACGSTACAGYATSPESYEHANTTAAPVALSVAVEAYSSSYTGAVGVTATAGALPDGYSCASAIAVSGTVSWTGSFAAYADLWDGVSGCGLAYGREVWFKASVAAGGIFTVEETTAADVTLHRLASCGTTTCLDYESSPELIKLYNDTGTAVNSYVVVEAYGSTFTGALAVTARNAPAPAGYTCAAPLDVSGGGTWSGDFASFDDLWTAGGGCSYVAHPDPEVWLRGTVPNGNVLTVEETTATDVTIHRLSACPSGSCLTSVTSPERFVYANTTGVSQTVYLAMEAYNAASGAWAVTATNAPP